MRTTIGLRADIGHDYSACLPIQLNVYGVSEVWSVEFIAGYINVWIECICVAGLIYECVFDVFVRRYSIILYKGVLKCRRKCLGKSK